MIFCLVGFIAAVLGLGHNCESHVIAVATFVADFEVGALAGENVAFRQASPESASAKSQIHSSKSQTWMTWPVPLSSRTVLLLLSTRRV